MMVKMMEKKEMEELMKKKEMESMMKKKETTENLASRVMLPRFFLIFLLTLNQKHHYQHQQN